MASHQSSRLESLPTETLEQICRYVLCSPSGVITLGKSLPFFRYKIYTADMEEQEEIKLSFLRTCKRISEVSKDMIWKYNTLDITHLDKFVWTMSHGYRPFGLTKRAMRKVQAIQLDINFVKGPPVDEGEDYYEDLEERLEAPFRVLADWVHNKNGNLCYVRLYAVHNGDSRLGHNGIKALCRVSGSTNPQQREVYETYLQIFKKAFGPNGYLKDTSQGIFFQTRPHTGSLFQKETRLLHPQSKNPNVVIEEVFKALQGHIFFDDQLLYNGNKGLKQKMRTPFPFYVLMEGEQEGCWVYEQDRGFWNDFIGGMKLWGWGRGPQI